MTHPKTGRTDSTAKHKEEATMQTVGRAEMSGTKLTQESVPRREGPCKHREERGGDLMLGTTGMGYLHWEEQSL